MKLIRFATLTALSTALLSASVQAFAEEEETTPTPSSEVSRVITDGEVSFTATDEDGEGEDTVVNPPVDEPDVTIPPVVGPDGENKGPLTIAYVPTMNFGSQVISNQDQTYSMIAELQKTAEDDLVPYVSFAEVQDTRGTNAGWNLHVKLSPFESKTQNNVLTGAKITLRDPQLNYLGSNQNNRPAIHENNLELIPDAGSVPIMTAADTKGAGSSAVVWGDQKDLDRQAEDEEISIVRNHAIVLSVPGTTTKDATTYEATLTWELTALPDNGEPDEENEA